VPRPFYGNRQLALMPGAVPGHPFWQDLAPFGYELAQFANIFKIDMLDFISAKSAYLATSSPWPHATAFFIADFAEGSPLGFSHGYFSFHLISCPLVRPAYPGQVCPDSNVERQGCVIIRPWKETLAGCWRSSRGLPGGGAFKTTLALL
jgi:hypothetical protein